MKKASEQIKRYENPNGPIITTIEQPVIEQDGLFFKDLDGSGVLKQFCDWRLSPEQRAKALVKELSREEKIGQLFVISHPMGKDQDKEFVDETGLLDEKVLENDSIFAGYTIKGTTDAIQKDHARNFILKSQSSAGRTDRLDQPDAENRGRSGSFHSCSYHFQLPQRKR